MLWHRPNAHNGSLTSAQTRYHYISTDHLGTPMLAVNKSGNKTWRSYQEAFGHTGIESTAGTQINLRFPGQYFDQETGLHQNFFRDYSPARGRYIQSDPIGLWGGINTYGYAYNEPMGYLDPYGLWLMAYGLWLMAYGLWLMAYGLWLMAYGLWAWGDPIDQRIVGFGAGFGDVITFGLTRRFRDGVGIGGVDICSNFYKYGEYAGIAGSAATGFVGGSRFVASRLSRHTNFSHSLFPARSIRNTSKDYIRWLDNSFGRWLVKGKNRLNGDYLPVSMKHDLHARMDPKARGGLSVEWLENNELFGARSQMVNRMPYTPGEIIYGASSFVLNKFDECGCQ